MAIYAAQALMLALAARLVSAEGGPDVLPRRTASRTAYRDSSSFLGACLPPGFAQPQIGKVSGGCAEGCSAAGMQLIYEHVIASVMAAAWLEKLPC